MIDFQKDKRLSQTMFVDGSCNSKDPLKRGGYGVFIPGEPELHVRRGYWNTTTSRMEMMALLEAVRFIKPEVWTNIVVVSDSEFVVNSFKKGWLKDWRIHDYLGVKNSDLWKEIVKEIEVRRRMYFSIKYIKGHQKGLSDPLIYGNNCADALSKYDSQENYIQDLPLPKHSWFLHEGSDCIFIERTDRYAELNKMGDVMMLGDCYYATNEELFERLNGTWAFEQYWEGKFEVSLKVEEI